MRGITRRTFLMGGAALSTGCAGLDMQVRSSRAAPPVRAPAVNQSWTYARHDLVTGELIDQETDRVASHGRAVEIEERSTGVKPPAQSFPSWGIAWEDKYLGAKAPANIAVGEIQSPWGMVLFDTHWSQWQTFERPLPLWPSVLRPGWSTTVNTRYKTPELPDELPWQLTMTAHEWQVITVPAARFDALRYTNLINFRFTNVSGRDSAQRQETVWFVPEIGRWAARESFGTYYQDVGERFRESSYRWELLEWT